MRPSSKPRLGRRRLERHGVFYAGWQRYGDCDVLLGAQGNNTPDVWTRLQNYMGANIADELFPSVGWLRELLLDTTNLLPSCSKSFITADERAQLSVNTISEDEDNAYPGNHQGSSASIGVCNFVQEVRRLSVKAANYQRGGADEHDWQNLMEGEVFKRYYDSIPYMLDGQFRDPLFDAYEICSNAPWTNPRLRSRAAPHSPLPDPKPDLSFEFPIHRFCGPFASGFENSAPVQNFSLDGLHCATDRGVICQPGSMLTNLGEDNGFIPRSRLVCFPFAIAEFKHAYAAQRQEEYCIWQAANAASWALKILQSLFASEGEDQEPDIPPVVVFTSTGPRIRVWIAQSVRGPNEAVAHVMRCIAICDVTTFGGIIKIHSIVGNMLRWATRILKPQLSAQLSRLKSSKCTPSVVPRPAVDTNVTPTSPIATSCTYPHSDDEYFDFLPGSPGREAWNEASAEHDKATGITEAVVGSLEAEMKRLRIANETFVRTNTLLRTSAASFFG